MTLTPNQIKAYAAQCVEEYHHRYSAPAVDAAIRSSRKPIGKKEARLIHALLKGRG